MRSSRMTIWVMVVVLCISSSQVMGLIEYNDGGTYDIITTINDDVWVDWEALGMGTTVNVVTGGGISALRGFNNSNLIISGGTVADFYAYDDSQVTMSDGVVSQYFYAYDDSQVTMSGGMMSNLYAYGNSQVTMSGGTLSILYLSDYSQVTMSGGTIGDGVILTGNVLDTEDAELVLKGFDFAIDGIPVGYGNITSILGGEYFSEPYRTLTGTFLNGDSIDNLFRIGYTAQITLIPEPATLLLLGLGGLMIRRKK